MEWSVLIVINVTSPFFLIYKMFSTSSRHISQDILEYSDYPTIVQLWKVNRFMRQKCQDNSELIHRKRCDYLLSLLDKDYQADPVKYRDVYSGHWIWNIVLPWIKCYMPLPTIGSTPLNV